MKALAHTSARTPQRSSNRPFGMTHAFWTPLCALLILAGCTNLAPRYERPQAPVPAALDNTATVASRAKSELAAEVGVNLDEEAARLIQFQQNYQAAAKMLQTAQTLFESLLASVSR